VAVALRYAPARDQAPRVLVKGVDAQAEAIKDVARLANVPLMRNVPLARALLECELEEEIPEELFDAVAEILNVVYQLGVAHA
jgi:flagellar biosynthetic protein FlhB